MTPVPFDSDLFGIRVFRAEALDLDDDLSGCDLLYVVTPHALPREVLARHGGTLLDLRRVYERRFSAPVTLPDSPAPGLSFATLDERPLPEGEVGRLVDLGLQSGIHSRYFRDPHIPREWYRKMYRAWMMNSLSGQVAYTIMTARLHGTLQGFITLQEKGPDTTNLSLVGVAEDLRGRGIGTSLLIATLNYIVNVKRHGVVTVVTHGHNEALCRFYERQGFRLVEAQNVYHCWPAHRETGSRRGA